MIDIERLNHLIGPAALAALCDDDGDGEPDNGVIDRAIGDALAEVRAAYTRGGVYLPDPLPADLEDAVATLAIARLHERRREALPEPWRERVARTRAELAAISAGRHPGAEATARAVRPPEERVFDDRTLDLF